MKTIIHINQHAIRNNRKNKTQNPIITTKTYKSNKLYSSVEILGPCRVIYNPEKPLSCGATVWIETLSQVKGE